MLLFSTTGYAFYKNNICDIANWEHILIFQIHLRDVKNLETLLVLQNIGYFKMHRFFLLLCYGFNRQAVCTKLVHSRPIELDTSFQPLDCPNCTFWQIWQSKIRHDFHHWCLANVVRRILADHFACTPKRRNDANRCLVENQMK